MGGEHLCHSYLTSLVPPKGKQIGVLSDSRQKKYSTKKKMYSKSISVTCATTWSVNSV